MKDSDVRYALAMPDTPKFEAQRDRVEEWVRFALGLHWILVDDRGELMILLPEAEAR